MSNLKYNFTDDAFTVYNPVEEDVREIEYPLSTSQIFDSSGISNTGIPIFKGIVQNTNTQSTPIMTVNNNEDQIQVSQPLESDVESNVEREKPKKVKGNSLANGKYVINALMSRLKLSKEQAAGIAGVMMSESAIDPTAYNKSEKSGKLKASSANGPGYGAGIIQWSNARKRAALRLIGKEGANIEDLSMDDQIEMLARELEGPYKATLSGIRSSKTASEAAATMYCHNVGGFSSSINPATKQEIEQMNKRYSKFAHNIINRGMSYAESLAKS